MSYLFGMASAVAMVALGLLLPAIVVQAYSRFRVGAALIFGVFLVDTLSMGEGVTHIGINLFYPDIVLGLIASAAGLRLVFARDLPQQNRAWLFFCALVWVSLLTGLLSFGTTAGVQARSYFYFMAAGLYAMSFTMNEERLRYVFNALAVTAFLLACLAAYRWTVYFLPISSLLPPGGTYNVDGPIRVIYSYEVLVLAQVLVAGVFYFAAARGFALARWFSPLLLGMVLVLQHRSVWLSALVGFMARILLGRSKTGSTFSQLLIVAGIVVVAAVPLAFSEKLSGVTQQVGSSATRALAGEDTTGERLKSWREIIKNWYKAGVRSIVIGQSFGTDNSRYVEDSHGILRKINYVAHNLYVQTLFNTGLLGLLALLAAIRYVVLGLYRICRDGRGGVEAEILMVLMAMQLAYYIPYGTDYLQSLLFGVALAYVAGKNAVSQKAVVGKVQRGALA